MTYRPAEVRAAMRAARLQEHAVSPSPPAVEHVFAPPGHERALQPKVALVVGTRGAGKTFWTRALVNPSVRDLLRHTTRVDLTNVSVDLGHSERSLTDQYPDAAVFEKLLDGFEPLHVWRAVTARWMARVSTVPLVAIPTASWDATVVWAAHEPESFARLAEATDSALGVRGTTALLVFDALDRLGRDWTTRAKVTRALLELLLQLRSFSHLRGKAFLREDEVQRSEVTAFADASKLLAERADLTWSAVDLHGLLWQYLLNAPAAHGERLRALHEHVLDRPPEHATDGVWTLTRRDRSDETALRALYESLSGPWMGRDRRRGATFPWIVTHLADSRGRASPRSFLHAIGVAADVTSDRYPEHDRPLHVDAIKAGVQAASSGRVDELLEDHRWAQDPLNALKGRLTVPCAFADVVALWSTALGHHLPPTIAEALPPEEVHQGWGGVRVALERMGVFERLRDERVNLPDLYRVGLSMGRKGGVRPVRRSN